MAGINRAIIVGRVGDTPETRKFNSGDQVAEFSVATSEQWRDKQTGERRERTEWHRVKVLNNGLIDGVIRPFVEKGSLIGIEGELQTEKWKDRDGNERYKTKIVVTAFRGSLYLLGSKGDGGGDGGRGRDDRDSGGGRRENNRSADRGNQRSGHGGSSPSFRQDMDDDIPFAPEWRG